MDISNKTLAMFLVAAIVVSIAGTTISLNRLGQVKYGPTGFADYDIGNVTVNVGSTLSISISGDNTIAFGTCTPVGGQDIVLDSEGTGAGNCSVMTGAGDHIIVINDGNLNANVSINVSDVGEVHSGNFLPTGAGTKSWIAYKTTDVATDCQSGEIGSYTNFTSTASWYQACTNLTPGGNGIQFDVEILLGSDATTASSYIDTTFWAKNA
ncbi:hypothetical protein GF367_04490 [Candidatus Woesearchaeota archaeon]|nr:hypothetical protein [Candidatus Woesearchaeota archaeon]